MASNHKKDFISLFTHHRVAANLLMVIVIIFGIWALQKLNTQFFPNFALDIVNIRTVWTGASAEDVEESITKPLEQELFTLDNIHKLSSTSATGVSADAAGAGDASWLVAGDCAVSATGAGFAALARSEMRWSRSTYKSF